MTTVDEVTEVDYACQVLLEIRAELMALTVERDIVRERRHAPLKTLMKHYGKDMISRGQRTKKISADYTLEAGLNPIHLCACHRVYVRTCPDLTDSEVIEIVTGGYEPYIRVIFTGKNEAL